MSLTLTAYFSEYGVPKTGLSPTITMKAISDGSTVVNAQAMTETGLGWYKYTYEGASNTEDYVGYADGGAGQPAGERYAPISSGIVGAVQNIVNTILAGEVENSVTIQHVLSIILAFVSGKTSGGGGTSIVFRNNADDTDRLTMTVDSDGDRSAVAVDVSDL